MSHTQSWDYHTSPVGSPSMSSVFQSYRSRQQEGRCRGLLQNWTLDHWFNRSLQRTFTHWISWILHQALIIAGPDWSCPSPSKHTPLLSKLKELHYGNNSDPNHSLAHYISASKLPVICCEGASIGLLGMWLQILKWVRSIPSQLRDTSPPVQLSGRT